MVENFFEGEVLANWIPRWVPRAAIRGPHKLVCERLVDIAIRQLNVMVCIQIGDSKSVPLALCESRPTPPRTICGLLLDVGLQLRIDELLVVIWVEWWVRPLGFLVPPLPAAASII